MPTPAVVDCGGLNVQLSTSLLALATASIVTGRIGDGLKGGEGEESGDEGDPPILSLSLLLPL